METDRAGGQCRFKDVETSSEELITPERRLGPIASVFIAPSRIEDRVRSL